LTVANVGDSRTYLIRKGEAQQLTADHTWVEEQVRVGLITREEAARHPQRNIITRSLGGNQKLEIDIFFQEVEPGDSVLLCSDGLSNMIAQEEIASIISNGIKAEPTVNELIELAKKRGAPDNVTAVLLNIVRRARGGMGRLLITAGILGSLALVVVAIALNTWTQSQNSQDPTSEPSVNAAATPTTSTATVGPTLSVATLPRPALVWPEENTSLVAGVPVTFAWNWEGPLIDGHFVFVLKAGNSAQPYLQEQLPLDRREFVISHSLEPGQHLWTMTVSLDSVPDGVSAGRIFTVVEPTPTGDSSSPN
jgi:hypothetical protein